MRTILLQITLLLIFTITYGQNQNISDGVVFDGEPYLSINPDNPQHMVVAWMGYVTNKRISIITKVTFDSGLTWSDAVSLPHTISDYTSADPCIAFDGNGNVFVSYIDFTGYNIFPLDGAVYVCKSTDGGLSWGDPVEVIAIDSDPGKKAIDRPWMVIDRSGGNNDGNIYITTMNAKLATVGYHPYITISTDGGSSFNNWNYLDTPDWLSGIFITQPMPTPSMSSGGDFFAVYPSYVFTQNPLAQYIITASADGGNSFNYSSVFTSSGGSSDEMAKMGYLLRSDPSDNNHLAFLYLEKTYGDLDVFYRESFDKGGTWTDGFRVNDDEVGNNRMQDLVWADYDYDGDLVVSWRDRRNSPDSTYTTSSEIWAAVLKKDSTNFSSNFPLSDNIVVYDSVLSLAGNDFMCVKFANDTINAVWGDTRTEKLNIWFQKTTIDGKLLSVSNIYSDNIPIINIFPVPFNSSFTVEGKGIMRINIYNINGLLVKRFTNINSDIFEIDFNGFPDGDFLLQVYTKDGSTTRKIVKANN